MVKFLIAETYEEGYRVYLLNSLNLLNKGESK